MAAAGAVGFDHNGQWKIHISIRPDQMERAIPIITQFICREDTPRLGLKIASQRLLGSQHQLGKEVALIFDQDVEQNPALVQTTLRALLEEFKQAGILPEEGRVLTPDTMEAIEQAPKGSQTLEKDNLRMGKMDRAIPCPGENQYFFYRNEQCIPMIPIPGEMENVIDRSQRIITGDVVQAMARDPNRRLLAHNPFGDPDPFLTIDLRLPLK